MTAISLFEIFTEFMTYGCALILSFTPTNSKFYFLVSSLFLYLQIPFSIFIAFIVIMHMIYKYAHVCICPHSTDPENPVSDFLLLTSENLKSMNPAVLYPVQDFFQKF